MANENCGVRENKSISALLDSNDEFVLMKDIIKQFYLQTKKKDKILQDNFWYYLYYTKV